MLLQVDMAPQAKKRTKVLASKQKKTIPIARVASDDETQDSAGTHNDTEDVIGTCPTPCLKYTNCQRIWGSMFHLPPALGQQGVVAVVHRVHQHLCPHIVLAHRIRPHYRCAAMGKSALLVWNTFYCVINSCKFINCEVTVLYDMYLLLQMLRGLLVCYC